MAPGLQGKCGVVRRFEHCRRKKSYIKAWQRRGICHTLRWKKCFDKHFHLYNGEICRNRHISLFAVSRVWMILMDCGIYCNFATGNQIIAYMLKNVGLYALSLLLSLFAVACDGNDNVENYSFPRVVAHCVGRTVGNKCNGFRNSGCYKWNLRHRQLALMALCIPTELLRTGTFSYLVSGQIIIFQKTCEGIVWLMDACRHR